MIAFIDQHVVLTICKFRFEAFFIPIKILCLFVRPSMLHTKKLTGMRNKETYMRLYTCICARTHIRKIHVYDMHMRSLFISELHCRR